MDGIVGLGRKSCDDDGDDDDGDGDGDYDN